MRFHLVRPFGFVVSVAALVAFAASTIVSAQQKKVDEELMQIERDWCAAAIKNDIAWFGRVFADDISLVGSTGQKANKTQAIADAKAEKYTACQVDQMQVRVYGDTAVVTGRSRVAGIDAKGKPFPHPESLWTDTFVRRGGVWQCVATQSTAVSK